MLSEDEILLNQLAQGRVAVTEGVAWFDSLVPAHQVTILTITLPLLLQQAHPTAQDIAQALVSPLVKPTLTPVVLFKVHPFPVALRKVTALPRSEWRNAFLVLLRVFQVADTRRRQTECRAGCYHAWHNLPE